MGVDGESAANAEKILSDWDKDRIKQATYLFFDNFYLDAAAIFIEYAEVDSLAASVIAKMYTIGMGFPRDDRKALYWNTVAANLGNMFAQEKVGTHYAKGQGTEIDEEKALYWFNKSVESGNTSAYISIAELYHKGSEAIKDYQKAVKYYKLAIEDDFIPPCVNLACMYEEGDGVERNLAEALKYYRKAADLGSKEAKEKVLVLEKRIKEDEGMHGE